MVYAYQKKGLQGKSRKGQQVEGVRTGLASELLSDKVEARKLLALAYDYRNGGYLKFRALCGSYCEEALAALVEALGKKGERVPAAKLILEYAFGKAPQYVELNQTQRKEKEVIALSKEKLEAIARAVLPEETESESENGDSEGG